MCTKARKAQYRIVWGHVWLQRTEWRHRTKKGVFAWDYWIPVSFVANSFLLMNFIWVRWWKNRWEKKGNVPTSWLGLNINETMSSALLLGRTTGGSNLLPKLRPQITQGKWWSSAFQRKWRLRWVENVGLYHELVKISRLSSQWKYT